MSLVKLLIKELKFQFGFKQQIQDMIGETSLCIDVIFTSQPKLVMESGFHLPLHQSYHYQIVSAKCNLKIYYPPSDEREKSGILKSNFQIILLDGHTLFNI